MKKCSQCGSLNDNKLLNCKECNNILDEPLSKVEEKEAIEQVDSLDDTFYESELNDNTYAPFIITLFDKIIGGLSAVGMVVSFFGICNLPRSENKFLLLISFILTMESFLKSFFPNPLWRLNKILLSICFSNANILEPSDFYMGLRKVSNVVFLFIGAYLILTY